MWMLTFIPDSVLLGFVNTILYAGIIGTVLGFVFNFSFLAPYRMIVQVVGVLLLAAGLYFKGGYEVEQQWRERVKDLEQKIALAEEKSKTANAEIQTKIVTKIQKVKEVQYKNKEVIKQVEKIINAECTVPKEAIEILNAAARNEVAGESK